jgi:hypothetical protein
MLRDLVPLSPLKPAGIPVKKAETAKSSQASPITPQRPGGSSSARTANRRQPHGKGTAISSVPHQQHASRPTADASCRDLVPHLLSSVEDDAIAALPQAQATPGDETHSVADKLAELGAAMQKFQTVAELALLNMGGRTSESSATDESRQWMSKQQIQDNVTDVMEILRDVSERNTQALSFVNMMADGDFAARAAYLNNLPSGMRSGRPNPLGASVDAVWAAGSLKALHGKKGPVRPLVTAVTGSASDELSGDTNNLDASAAHSSNMVHVNQNTVGLHRCLLELIDLTNESQEGAVRRGDPVNVPKYFTAVRCKVAEITVNAQEVSDALAEAQRYCVVADQRIHQLELEASDVASSTTNVSRAFVPMEAEQTVVVCEIACFRWLCVYASNDGSVAVDEARQLLDFFAQRTASACRGRLVMSHDEAFAVVFPSPLDALAWANCIQEYAIALPWPGELLDLPYCTEEMRTALSRRELQVTFEATMRPAATKAAQTARAVREVFETTLKALPAYRRMVDTMRKGYRGQSVELAENSANAGDDLDELRLMWARRGFRLRLGVHTVSIKDLRVLDDVPVNPGFYVAAIAAALAAPGETHCTQHTLHAATAQCNGSNPLNGIKAQTQETGSLHPFDQPLERCGVHNMYRLEWDAVAPAPSWSKTQVVPSFEPLGWLVRPFLPPHVTQAAEAHWPGGIRRTRTVGVTADAPLETATISKGAHKRRTVPVMMPGAAPIPSTAGTDGEQPLRSAKHTKSTKKKKRAAANAKAAVDVSDASGACSADDALQGSGIESGEGSGHGSPVLSPTRSGRGGGLPVAPPTSLPEVISYDVGCQAGDDTLFTAPRMQRYALGDAPPGSLGTDTIRLLSSIVARAEGSAASSDVCEALAAFIGYDGRPDGPSVSASSRRRMAHMTAPQPAAPAWSIAWARLDRRLAAYLPPPGQQLPLDVSEEVVCRDAIAVAMSLVDDCFTFLQAHAARKRQHEQLLPRMSDLLTSRATLLSAYSAYGQRQNNAASMARSMTAASIGAATSRRGSNFFGPVSLTFGRGGSAASSGLVPRFTEDDAGADGAEHHQLMDVSLLSPLSTST